MSLQLTPANSTDAGYAKLLASKIAAQSEKTIALISWQPDAASDPATVVLACSRDLPIDCGTLLRETVSAHGGRGGGSRDMAQGSVPAEHLQAVLTELARDVNPAP